MRSSCSVTSCGVPSVMIVLNVRIIDAVLPKMDRKDEVRNGGRRRHRRTLWHIGILMQLGQQRRALLVLAGPTELAMRAKHKLARHLVPVHDELSQALRMEYKPQEIHRLVVPERRIRKGGQ